MMRVTKKLYALLIAGMMAVSLAGCQSTGNSSNGEGTQNEQSSKGSTNSSTKSVSSDNIPDFSGNMTVAVDNNNPDFTSKDLTTKSYESYSRLDSEGRCQVAEACVGKDIMPKGKRGAIGMVKPTGWHTAKYNNVDGKYLYNRCHLIAYQLTGENANNKNLITEQDLLTWMECYHMKRWSVTMSVRQAIMYYTELHQSLTEMTW